MAIVEIIVECRFEIWERASSTPWKTAHPPAASIKRLYLAGQNEVQPESGADDQGED